ncbi:GerAB/ArcD/ProY family transporter [Virgibacillus salexigens]|uniref:GerAB/ArcD/ProY family transporter n=1 Tax=Virgibacillus TaxID=84406 RepID=UPI001367AE73|nr:MULTISPECIES: GerAB/ArcD/ProY family transporter [Virgibacillus]MYL41712.1 GerAB/ArcD/ProY family transporter [Virgibacillus massiliensis]
MSAAEPITKSQLFLLLIQVQIGFGILYLPNTLQQTAKSDGWISIILAGCTVQLVIVLYWLLLRRFPSLSYFELTKKILGAHLGYIFNVIIYIYLILTSTYILIASSKLVKNVLLTFSPHWAIGFLLLAVCIYLCSSNLQIIVRVFTILSVSIMFVILLSFLSFSLPIEVMNLTPVGSSGMSNIIKGLKESLLALYGFEIILFLYSSARHKGKTFLKVITFSNIFVVAITVYLTVIAFVILNPAMINQLKLPIVYMFRPLHFTMIDRIDLIFLPLWSIPVVMSIVVYIYFASHWKTTAPKKNNYFVYINGAIVYVLFLLASKSDQSFELYAKYLNSISYVVIFMIPFILLLFSYILKKKEHPS